MCTRILAFPHFDLQMCFALQRRAIFGHLNFEKWPESVVFCTSWLENALRATAACDFWTSELRKLLRDCDVLCILTCKCASRHSGIPFCRIESAKICTRIWVFPHFDLQMCFAPQPRAIFGHLNFAPRLRCFVHFDLTMRFAPQLRAIFHLSAEQLPPHRPLSEATFQTSGTTNHWKNTANRDVPNILRTYSFFLLTLRLSWSSF